MQDTHLLQRSQRSIALFQCIVQPVLSLCAFNIGKHLQDRRQLVRTEMPESVLDAT